MQKGFGPMINREEGWKFWLDLSPMAKSVACRTCFREPCPLVGGNSVQHGFR